MPAQQRPSRLDALQRVEVTSRAEWRAWLKKHHTRTEGIWLITYKKHVSDKYVSFQEKVQEALCFGWIDSTPRKLDADRVMHYLSPRKPKSVWSAINKAHVERLIAAKRMAPAGLKKIEQAKKDGSWNALEQVDALAMPAELTKAFARNKTAKKHFDAFPPSSKKIILHWVNSSKTDATRNKRTSETVSLAAKNIRANHYNRK
ncbi:MAG TPA: YdeI/OmpD-associated family protein [Flavobacteriales bacterium]|nr:YdeI/OmpD-associated family protein [Flavobacteriales bacterium]